MQYFDHAATHPLSDVARAAWLDAAARFPANPSSPHRLGARADRALESARERLATMLGCSPAEVIFTSGATESNNLMVHHLAQVLTGPVLVSSLEHPSVLEPARHELLERQHLIPATAAGVVDLPWLEARLHARPPAAVLLMAANNETGVLQPWREVAALCRERGIWFGCDAAQWVGKLPAAGLGACPLLTGCAHKFGGPPGVGFLKGPPTLRPLFRGGPQEDRRRAGTQNLPGILAMVACLESRERELAAGGADSRTVWRDRFVARVQQALPGTELLGAEAPASGTPSACNSRRAPTDAAGSLRSTVSASRSLPARHAAADATPPRTSSKPWAKTGKTPIAWCGLAAGGRHRSPRGKPWSTKGSVLDIVRLTPGSVLLTLPPWPASCESNTPVRSTTS
ncbi:MAG: aminotransferase class V-fold PLP-dependent enzyme [Verrucomicrobia bacterium]|nr:aminotransferase class V-fold PLP-dependent enzyme [Verrucomicrobiota bacterium]